MSIKTFAHKGVEEIFLTGRSRRIGAEFRQRMSLMLDAIDGATCAGDLRGARGFHALLWRSNRDLRDVGQRQSAPDLPLRTRR